MCPAPDRGLAPRDDVAPHPLDRVEQEEPCRAHQRLGSGQSGLRTAILGHGLIGSLVSLAACKLDQGLDRAPCNAQGDCAETRMDARRERDLVAWVSQHERVGVKRSVAGRYEAIL